MTRPVDYGDRLHRGYEQGRGLLPRAARTWRWALQRRLPPQRPLTTVDLGSGTGRMSSPIAEQSGRPIYAVEPAHRMRAIAAAEHPHDSVHYLGGRAEAIPLAAASCAAAVLFFVLHHVAELPAAAQELSRVLSAAGGVSMGLSSREGFGCSLWGAVGLAVAEHGVDDVGAAAGQADQGGVVPFAGGSLAVVVGPAVGVPERGERGEEQRRLQGVVAALGAGLALDRGAGAAGDRGEAGVGGEVRGGGERRSVADDGEQLDGGPDPVPGRRCPGRRWSPASVPGEGPRTSRVRRRRRGRRGCPDACAGGRAPRCRGRTRRVGVRRRAAGP